MFTFIRKHINYAMLLALVAVSQLLCSCFQHDYSDCPGMDEEMLPTTFISFSISTLDKSNSTRSNPTGGEDGDGREVGINKENNISDVTLFLFETNNNNVLKERSRVW